MKEWTKQVTPERYLKVWPNGPEAKLARAIVAGLSEEAESIKFYSPEAAGLSLVVESINWIKEETPGGTRTIQTDGKSVKFENGIFESDDEEVIEYLTNIYKDRRFPVVRTDLSTASAAR